MEKTRRPIPSGLAEMPPGPGLAAVLAEIELSRLSGLDCVTVLRAQHRQATHEQARLLAAMVEVARCGIGPDDELPRMDAPDEFSADEIRGALVWTRAAATAQLSLAWDLHSRLPDVFAALRRGAVDLPKARVLSEWTGGLTDEQARRVCEKVLPEASALTTGQLIDRIKKMAIAVDPDWARRRYAEAVRDRKVVGYRNEDGTANLCGYQLPADRAAAACANLDALAKKIKRCGDDRPIDRIRVDLYLAMLDGSYTGWSEHDIVAQMLAAARAAAESDETAALGCDADAFAARVRPGAQVRRPAETSSSGGADHADSVEHAVQGRSARRAGVEVRVELTTLLGMDDHPGELPGSGPIHADLARRLASEQTAAEWRYAITDDDGHLLHEGITRRRPKGFPARAESPARGGIVELQVPLGTLRHLAAHPVRRGGWANVIADLARQTDLHMCGTEETPDPARADARDDDTGNGTRNGTDDNARDGMRGGRAPGRRLRRRTEIRDRTCTHPRCRVPAHGTDGDHIKEWARGGSTSDDNIGSACRHDHRLRHEGGWTVAQPQPGHLIWTSRLGVHYHARPPLIIQPLPDPIPRESAPPYPHDDHHDGADAPIWREPAAPLAAAWREPDPAERPPPDPAEPIPF